MNTQVALMETGHICIICGSEQTSGHWRREGSDYLCGKCAAKRYRRKKGVFQDFKRKKAERLCFRCGSNETLEKTTEQGYKYKDWHRIEGEWHCYKCWCRRNDTTLICVDCGETFLTNYVNKHIYRTTEKCQTCRDSERKQKPVIKLKYGRFKDSNNKSRMKYKGRYVYLDPKEVEKKRTGYCSNCSNNIHDGSCKQTQLHHPNNEYDDNDPLWNTVELCASCHRKETIRLAKM